MLKRIFNSQTKTVTFAAVLLAASSLVSRLLGLIRDRLLAAGFGAGQELDIYFAAFRIPDFVYGILIMGGVAAIFLPVFSEYFRKGQEYAWSFVNNFLNCFLILIVLICGIMAVFAPWLVSLIAPGFCQESRELAVVLTRIMFISPVFLGISNIFSGVLHYFNRFFAYSLAPIMYNLGIIFGILFLVPVFGLYGLAYGVIAGAFFHWLVQIPAARKSGYKYLPVLNFKKFGLAKVFRLMVPRIIGAAGYHINLIVVTAVASTLAVGSITVFNFANNLQYVPVGLIGVSFSLAVFPVLSRKWAAGLKEDFFKTFSSTFRQILFLIIPASALIFILRAHIVRLVLGSGEFGWLETRLTAACLGIFCLSIFASSFIPFLARVFYSFQNTKTPVIISLVAVTVNVLLCFLFVFLLGFANVFQELAANVLKLQDVQNIGVIGLPLAMSISAITQFCLLLVFLKRKTGSLGNGEIVKSTGKILIASLLMTVFAYAALFAAAEFLNVRTFVGILIQTITACLAGLAAYISASFLLKSAEAKLIWLSVFKRRGKGASE